MRRYILDTGPAQNYVQRRGGIYQRTREKVAAGHRVGIAMPTLCELFAGVENSDTRDHNYVRLKHNLQSLTLWPLDRGAAEEFGRQFAFLKRIGRPMPQMDIQIASIALSLGNCTLVTKDSDFAAILGLMIEDWS